MSLDDIATYVENLFRIEKKIIFWDSTAKKFYIYKGSTDRADYEGSFNLVEFFQKFGRYIKSSPYYIEMMSYVLGQKETDETNTD